MNYFPRLPIFIFSFLSCFSPARLICGIAVVGGWFVFPVAIHALPEAEQRQFADGLFSRGLYEMAHTEYAKLLQENPRHNDKGLVLFRMAESQRQLGRNEAALQLYREVVAGKGKEDHVVRACMRLAQALVQQQQYAEALPLLESALAGQAVPEMTGAALFYKGVALARLHKNVESESALRQLLADHKHSPYVPYAGMELGLLLKAVKPADAIPFFRQAADAPATRKMGAEAWWAIGDLYFQLQQYDESALAFSRLLSRYPEFPQARQARLHAGWVYVKVGKYQDALDLVQTLSESERGEFAAEWRYLEANCLRQLDRLDEALKAYAALIERYPQSKRIPAARYEAALIQFSKKNFDHIVSQSERLLAEGVNPVDVLWLLAEANRAQEKVPAAIKHYLDLAARYAQSPRAPEAMYNAGQLHQQAEEYAAAAAVYRKLVAAYGGHELAPRASFNAGYAHARAGLDTEAVRDWDELLKRYPKNELADDALFQKAMAEMRLTLVKAAQSTWQQLLKTGPDSPFANEGRYWLGVLWEKEGKLEEPAALYRQALQAKVEPPLQEKIQYRLILLLQKSGKELEAADLLNAAVAESIVKDIDASVLEWGTRYRLDQQQPDLAVPLAVKLTGTGYPPRSRQIAWSLLGRARDVLKEPKPAADAFTRALELNLKTREAADAALYLGAYHLGTDQPTMAYGYYTQAGAIASELDLLDIQARSYYGLGRCAESDQQWGDAARYYMSVAVLFDDASITPECLYRAARAFEKAGKPKEAAQSLEELTTRYPDSDWATKQD